MVREGAARGQRRAPRFVRDVRRAARRGRLSGQVIRARSDAGGVAGTGSRDVVTDGRDLAPHHGCARQHARRTALRIAGFVRCCVARATCGVGDGLAGRAAAGSRASEGTRRQRVSRRGERVERAREQ